jgi:putative hydrolase of the HAD superfamily
MTVVSPLTGGPLDAVVLDWGGTLTEHVEVELIDMWRVAAERIDPGRAAELTDQLIAIEAAAWAKTTTTMRSSRLMDLLLEAGHVLDVDVAEAVLHAAQEAHLDAWTPSIRHRTDAVPTLRRLREAGLKVGMLSNTHWPRSFHEQFLERDGLDGLIDVRLYTSEIDWVKPHIQPFATVVQRLRVPMERCVFVGDRPIDDIQGAVEAGMSAVWVRNDHTPGDPSDAHAVIDALSELPGVLGLA